MASDEVPISQFRQAGSAAEGELEQVTGWVSEVSFARGNGSEGNGYALELYV